MPFDIDKFKSKKCINSVLLIFLGRVVVFSGGLGSFLLLFFLLLWGGVLGYF